MSDPIQPVSIDDEILEVIDLRGGQDAEGFALVNEDTEESLIPDLSVDVQPEEQSTEAPAQLIDNLTELVKYFLCPQEILLLNI